MYRDTLGKLPNHRGLWKILPRAIDVKLAVTATQWPLEQSLGRGSVREIEA